MQSVDGTASGASVSAAEGGDASANGFYKEGITIKCPNANVGDKGTVDGVVYTKRNRDSMWKLRGEKNYDDLAKSCTTGVTDMGFLFERNTDFNSPIGHWDTSEVTTMSAMFQKASAFNQDISGWNTAKVMDMGFLFSGATSFNQPIGEWDTAKVLDMRAMFQNAPAFNKDISGWNTAKVLYMRWMFEDATNFNQPIGTWDTAKVRDMGYMFSGAKAFSGDLSGWNVLKVFSQPNGCQNFCDKAGSLTPPGFQIYRKCGEPGCSEL